MSLLSDSADLIRRLLFALRKSYEQNQAQNRIIRNMYEQNQALNGTIRNMQAHHEAYVQAIEMEKQTAQWPWLIFEAPQLKRTKLFGI